VHNLTKLPRDIQGNHAIKALKKIGWNIKTIKGSHYHLCKGQEIITIPCHSKPLKPRILSIVIKLAGLTINQFKELL